MSSASVQERFLGLSTPLVADAAVRLGLPAKIAPRGARPLVAGSKLAGPASPVVLTGHAHHVLEGIYRARAGDVLLLDNRGRDDAACFGDLAAYEARSQGLAGVVIWGLHRDSAEVAAIGVPVFSYGTYPLGMQRTHPPVEDAFARCQLGDHVVERGELVVADDDGALVVPEEHAESVLAAAEEIKLAEDVQVENIRAGTSLREQVQFDRYLRERESDPSLTFGEHMRRMGRHF